MVAGAAVGMPAPPRPNHYPALHGTVHTEYTERWPCPLFDILLDKHFPLASLVAGRRPQCTVAREK
jgi:hypothetical protein